MKTLFRPTLLFVFLAWTAMSRAEVTVAPLFSDGAVLQRDKPLPIWGWAAAGEKVTVTFAGQKREATPGVDGRWLVLLDPLPASTRGMDLTITGANTLTLRDVLVGEVWICAGQSNMEWPVSHSANASEEIAAANFPLLRHVKIERVVAEMPADEVPTRGWRMATPETVGAFTAVGYFFARDLHQKLGVPIGLVSSSWGGTPVEAWMSQAALAENPAFKIVDERWARILAEYSAKQAAYESNLAAWAAAEAAARAEGKLAHDAFAAQNPRPRPPVGPGHHTMPRGLFNGMINPLLPYAMRGVLWYQGERNVGRASEYHALFSAMITAWRAHFGQGDFPFFWVNLASFRYPNDKTGTAAAFLREAQTKTLALPNTGQALAIDVGDANDIHPTNKQEVGRRLALLAKQRVYDLIGDDTGPTFASATRDTPPAGASGAMRVRFTHVGGGLVAHGKPVQSLQLAGEDRVFHPAEGRIERGTLLVFSTKVKEPVAVRYAWSNAPKANLFNGSGLPAVPFRSDSW